MSRPPLAGILVAAAIALLGASPAPAPAPSGPPDANHLTAAQMKALLPATAVHAEYEVAVNKLGQVTVATPKVVSTDKRFNLETYGNALQAFIRTEDGHAISGLYRLSYDYNPATKRIARTVALIHPGGVDANAEGAADVMIDTAKKEAAAQAAKAKHSPHP